MCPSAVETALQPQPAHPIQPARPDAARYGVRRWARHVTDFALGHVAPPAGPRSGRKARSREAALLLLADDIEDAARVMD